MEAIIFYSANPFEHVQRALDMLRKMGFRMSRLTIEEQALEYAICIEFEQSGAISSHVFIQRLTQLDGLKLVSTGVRASACPSKPLNPDIRETEHADRNLRLVLRS